MTTGDVALRLTGVSLVRDGQALLDAVDWVVREGERWIVLGPNGSGKTSLVRIASLYAHPSKGKVEVLGETLGRADVRRLRRRIGVISGALTAMLRPDIRVLDVVMTARNAALEPWWHTYGEDDRQAALGHLATMGVAPLAERSFGTLSDGERQRVLLARLLMPDPGLLLFDEPSAGLDLAAREQLVSALAGLAGDRAAPPMVFVTHHVEEIPPGFTHLALLQGGRIHAAGRLDDVLTGEVLSTVFGLELALERHHGRWQAWATG